MSNPSRERAETAVREYLRALELVGRGQRTSAARDSALGRVFASQAKVDRERVRAAEPAFLRHAGSWARWQGVTAKTLREFGVAEEVLERAGLELTPLEETIRGRYGRRAFTARDLAVRLGVPIAAVRRTISEDVARGAVARVGSRARGRGRPAITYRVVCELPR